MSEECRAPYFFVSFPRDDKNHFASDVLVNIRPDRKCKAIETV